MHASVISLHTAVPVHCKLHTCSTVTTAVETVLHVKDQCLKCTKKAYAAFNAPKHPPLDLSLHHWFVVEGETLHCTQCVSRTRNLFEYHKCLEGTPSLRSDCKSTTLLLRTYVGCQLMVRNPFQIDWLEIENGKRQYLAGFPGRPVMQQQLSRN